MFRLFLQIHVSYFLKAKKVAKNSGGCRVCERGTEMSAANFGREATHALRVTGPPGFAESEMTGSARQGPGASLPLSWRTRKGVPLFKAETCKFSACADSKNLPRPRQF